VVAGEAVQLADSTDDLNRRGKAQSCLGEVLVAQGKTGEAACAFQRAVKLYEEKGNIVSAARVRSRETELISA
jgi:hypothetical protein